jgi:hypothetical protein
MNSILVFILALCLSALLGTFDRHECTTPRALRLYRAHISPLGIFTPLLRVLIWWPPTLALIATVLSGTLTLVILLSAYSTVIIMIVADSVILKKWPIVLSLYNGIADDYDPLPLPIRARIFIH